MATLTPQIAKDLMERSMLTGVPTSEFDKYGGYSAVAAMAQQAPGYTPGTPSAEAIVKYGPKIAEQGYGNMSYAPGSEQGYYEQAESSLNTPQKPTVADFSSVFDSIFKNPYRQDLLDDLEARINRTTDRLNQQAQQQAGFYGTTGSSQSAMLQALNNQRGLEALQSGTAQLNANTYDTAVRNALNKYATDANYALGYGRLNLDAYNSQFNNLLNLGQTQQGILNQQFAGGLAQQQFENNKSFDAAQKYAQIVSANYGGGYQMPTLYSPWGAAFAGAQQGATGNVDPLTGAVVGGIASGVGSVVSNGVSGIFSSIF